MFKKIMMSAGFIGLTQLFIVTGFNQALLPPYQLFVLTFYNICQYICFTVYLCCSESCYSLSFAVQLCNITMSYHLVLSDDAPCCSLFIYMINTSSTKSQVTMSAQLTFCNITLQMLLFVMCFVGHTIQTLLYLQSYFL